MKETPDSRAAANAAPKAAAERAHKLQVEEAVAEEFTGKVRIAHAIQLEGRPGLAGQQFEVWTTGGQRCLVVAQPDPATAKVIVCVSNAGAYLAKYLVNGQVREERAVETRPVTLAVEMDYWRAEWMAENQLRGL
jgi:hypothetical protein